MIDLSKLPASISSKFPQIPTPQQLVDKGVVPSVPTPQIATPPPTKYTGGLPKEFTEPIKQSIQQKSFSPLTSAFQQSTRQQAQKPIEQVANEALNTVLTFGSVGGGEILPENPGILRRNWSVPKPEVFEGFKDMTTKVLDKLTGRSQVSKQFISDLTNSGELKQVERDLIRNILKDVPDKVNVQEFANKVKMELLPLKVKSSDTYKPTGTSSHVPEAMTSEGDFTPKYENRALSDELRGPVANYSEHLYQSPIKTSAGDVHFNYQAPNYFAHTRVEDLADAVKGADRAGLKIIKTENSARPYKVSGGGVDQNFATLVEAKKGLQDLKGTITTDTSTRRVIELQSDLFQKGNLERENRHSVLSPGEKVGDIGTNEKFLARQKETAKLEPYRNTWHERVIKEEIKKAAQDGKTKLQFPTGETAMKIEGLGDNTVWSANNANDISIGELKVGREIYRGNRDIGTDENDAWIITDVLGDGKFRAIPKERLNTISGRILEEQGKLKDTFWQPDKFIEQVEAKTGLPRNKIGGGEMRNAGFSEADTNKFYDKIFKSQDITAAQTRAYVDSHPIQDILKHKAVGEFTETFDISGKVDTNNPIYKFYEDKKAGAQEPVGSYLKRKYGAQRITDPQGVTWWEIPIKKAQAKLPIEAFAALPFIAGMKRKEQ